MRTIPTMSTVINRADLPSDIKDSFLWPEIVLTQASPKGDNVSPHVRVYRQCGLTNDYFRFTLDDVFYCVTPEHSLHCAIRERWEFLNYGRPCAGQA